MIKKIKIGIRFHHNVYDEMLLLLDLGKRLDLIHAPELEYGLPGFFVLTGKINGYITLIHKLGYVISSDNIWSVIVRHEPFFTSNPEQKILNELRAHPLFRKEKSIEQSVYNDPHYTELLLNKNTNRKPLELANKIRMFQRVISEYAYPLPEALCENNNCKYKLEHEGTLIKINGISRLFCNHCLDELQKTVRPLECPTGS